MKMAVLIQPVVGSQHEHYFYPDAAGVARSLNFYPSPGEKLEDGISLAVLGLGSTVVDGGIYTRFSPAPGAPPPFSEGKKYKKLTENNLQRSFLALDVKRPLVSREGTLGDNVVELDMSAAARHGTLSATGSNFHPKTRSFSSLSYHPVRKTHPSKEQQKTKETPINRDLLTSNVHGVSQNPPKIIRSPNHSFEKTSKEETLADVGPSVPVVTMSNILDDPGIALKEVIQTILKIGTEGFACPVEIEWALTLSRTPEEPHAFYILQVRPMTKWNSEFRLGVDHIPSKDMAICTCTRAFGHGMIEGIRDIVFVPNFEPARAKEIAQEIAQHNAILNQEKRRYLLIGPGKFGSKDPKKGIPLSWQSINGAACLIETELEGVTSTSEGMKKYFLSLSLPLPLLLFVILSFFPSLFCIKTRAVYLPDHY